MADPFKNARITKAMNTIIITAGEKYNDIDALACSVAYSNLLKLQGISNEVVLTGPLNESVPKSVREFGYKISTVLTGIANDYNYVLVDISDHTNMSAFVPAERVIEVYDHRWGFEDYWKKLPNVKTVIDPVGSCATLIWEKYKELGLQNKIDTISAKLLYTAIISNTLNLRAQITNERDIAAAKELKVYSKLPENWTEVYFDEVTASILADPVNAINNDTKVGPINGVDFYIMQIELWDSNEFIARHGSLIQQLLKEAPCEHAFLTSPSISEGKNYILTLSDKVKTLLTKRINATFTENLGTTDKLWLRKEIIRELLKD